MWLSVGASAASYNWLGGCGAVYSGIYSNWYSGWSTACHETRAVTAFGFLTWLMCTHHSRSNLKLGSNDFFFFAVLAYNVYLGFLTVRQHLRQNTGIWTSFVDDANFDAPPVGGQIPPAKVEAQYASAPATQPGTPYAPQVAQ